MSLFRIAAGAAAATVLLAAQAMAQMLPPAGSAGMQARGALSPGQAAGVVRARQIQNAFWLSGVGGLAAAGVAVGVSGGNSPDKLGGSQSAVINSTGTF